MKKCLHKVFAAVKQWLKVHGWEIGGVVAIFALDQLTKYFARTALQNVTVVVFPFFHLRYVENTGAAFGTMQHNNFLLIFVMLAIIVYLLKSWRELCGYGKLVHWGCVFILAGALGNLYDRIRLGYVIDFLDFLVWPVFNIADSFITIGGGLFLLSLALGFTHKREEK